MEKQKKWNFNVIDVLFVLVVLAAIALLVFRFVGPELPGTEDSDPEDYYVVTFASDAVNDFVLDHVRLDAPVTDDSRTRDLGTVVDIQTAPSIYYGSDHAGNTVVSSRDDTKSLSLMCRVRGKDSGSRIVVDGYNLDIGSYYVVRAAEAKMYLVVRDIQKLTDTGYSLPDSAE